MTYEAVAATELAAVVTFLEMRERPALDVCASPLLLRHIAKPDPAAYRNLFRLVGARWLWFSRLIMDDAKLASIIQDSGVELFAVEDANGRDCGMIELDFREPNECELSFLGLTPDFAGKGHGRWLLAEALRHAWREGVERVHVHTCSLDHPAALPAYRRAGFTAYKRAIERFPTPACSGYSRGTAPLRSRCSEHPPEVRPCRIAGRKFVPA